MNKTRMTKYGARGRALIAGTAVLAALGITAGIVAVGSTRADSNAVYSAATAGATGTATATALPHTTVKSHTTVKPEQGKTSVGVHIYNNTPGNMVLVAEGGDNAGMQPLGETLAPGTGYHDFEVVFRAANKTTDYAVYTIEDSNGNEIGETKIEMTVDEFKSVSVSSQFRSTDGSSMPLETASYKDGYEVVSSTGGETIDASTPLAAGLARNICNDPDTTTDCTYTPTGKSAGSVTRLLAMSYSQPGGGNTESTLSVESGYEAKVTDSWSITGSVKAGLEGVLNIGIEATYGQSVSNETTFTSSESIPIQSGYTGYIWGNVPVTNYTGTLQIKLGSATYNVQNTQVGVPDGARELSGFLAGTYAGNDPLNSPDTPPPAAKALK